MEPGQLSHYQEAFAIHSPVEPLMGIRREHVLEFSGGKRLEVLVTPSVTRSDESLKTLEPAERSCYLDGERKLRFFKVYTLRNCKYECFANFTVEACNCSEFESVRDPDSKICGISYEDQICSRKFGLKVTALKVSGSIHSCSCLPTCDSVTYNFEIIESKFRGNE